MILRKNKYTLLIISLICFLLLILYTSDILVTDGSVLKFDDLQNGLSEHRLAVVIPFRDRFTELQQFIPHLNFFLTKQNILHNFYLVNQVDNFRFNRAALLNIGALESEIAESKGIRLCLHSDAVQLLSMNSSHFVFPRTDYFAFHDVDLLPLDPGLSYSWPETGPVHLIPASIHPRYYWVKNYFGGIVLMRRDHFRQVNGFSNSFWGWGWEDDEFRIRVTRAGFEIKTPVVASGFRAFHVIHNEAMHTRDTRTYLYRNVKKLIRLRRGGLDTVNYTVTKRRLLHINGIPVFLINVALRCNTDADLCDQDSDYSSKNLPRDFHAISL